MRGVTLLEFVVAGSIFIVLVTFVLVIFLSSLGGQRKVTSVQNVSDNTRFLLNSVAKEVRVATICGRGAAPGTDACQDWANNSLPGSLSKRLDIVRKNVTPFAYVSYCVDTVNLTLKRLVNTATFSRNPCTDPAGRALNSADVAVEADSGFVIGGLGQTPPPSGPCRPEGVAGPRLDLCQPRVTILLHVFSRLARSANEEAEAMVQTTLSQRVLDLP